MRSYLFEEIVFNNSAVEEAKGTCCNLVLIRHKKNRPVTQTDRGNSI